MFDDTAITNRKSLRVVQRYYREEQQAKVYSDLYYIEQAYVMSRLCLELWPTEEERRLIAQETAKIRKEK